MNYFLYDSKLDRRFYELGIILVGRHWYVIGHNVLTSSCWLTPRHSDARNCEFEWYAHRPMAELEGILSPIFLSARNLKSRKLPVPLLGISKEATDAIANGRYAGNFLKDDERVVYHFAMELLQNKGVSDKTFAAAKELLGYEGIIDLIGAMNYYTGVCMYLNVDKVRPS